MKKLILSLCVLSLIISCVPEVKKQKTNVILNHKNSDFKKIYDYISLHQVDSLIPYLNHEDPTFRYLVANGFASLNAERYYDSLFMMMNDPIIDVKSAAAYALGQQYDETLARELISNFKSKDTLSIDNLLNANILESTGKIGDLKYLEALSSVKTYRKTDTLLLLGQTRGIYRYALRGITSESGTKLMVDYVTDNSIPEEVRLIAAHYLSRSKDIDITNYQFRISENFTSERNPMIRMALASALRKSDSPEILQYLKSQFKTEEDYRVKCNIIRSYKGFDYFAVKDDVLVSLTDKNIHVANTAADYLISNGIPREAMIYINYAKDDLPYSVKAKIYSAVFKHLPHYYTNSRSVIRKKVKEWIDNAKDPYEKSAYISILSYDPSSYKLVMKELESADSSIAGTTLVNALGKIISTDIFDRTYKSRSRRVRTEVLDTLKSKLKTGDAGMVAVIGGCIANPAAKLKPLIDNSEFMRVARAALKLPSQVESYNELSKAIAYIDDKEYSPKELEYSQKANWTSLDKVTDSTEVIIKTNKGNIKFELYPFDAPQSVANFVNLTDKNFYDGIVFHRVVPNFVIQGGCPRGDGYGSLDYVINSELSQKYYDDEGYIGMASAGKHTEGTQWFITHSPTPHLDGKYTIFGKVTEGMDIVHDIQVGDNIIDVIIMN